PPRELAAHQRPVSEQRVERRRDLLMAEVSAAGPTGLAQARQHLGQLTQLGAQGLDRLAVHPQNRHGSTVAEVAGTPEKLSTSMMEGPGPHRPATPAGAYVSVLFRRSAPTSSPRPARPGATDRGG